MALAESKSVSSKPRRRWLRFSLRTLLLFVFLASLALGWFGKKYHEARRQKAAIEAIKAVGGFAFYDCQINGSTDAPEPGPTWVRDFLGIDFLAHMRQVWIGDLEVLSSGDDSIGTRIDFDFYVLRDLPELKELVLNSCIITDNDLRIIGELERLEVLACMNPSEVSDVGVARIAKMANLEFVNLDGAQVTDAGVRHLARLRNLKHLELSRTQIGDAGLAALAHHPRLETLEVDSTDISDQGLEHLATLPRLWRLNIAGTRVTDAGLRHLPRIQNLGYLDIVETEITDDSIEHIAACKKIGVLYLSHTRLTTKGIEELRKALPDCEIY